MRKPTCSISSCRRCRRGIRLTLRKGVSVLVDEDGHIVSLEVLDARERLGAAVHASTVAIEQLAPPTTAEKVAQRRRPAIRGLVAAGE